MNKLLKARSYIRFERILFLILLLEYGCGSHLINMKPEDHNYLKEQREVKAISYPSSPFRAYIRAEALVSTGVLTGAAIAIGGSGVGVFPAVLLVGVGGSGLIEIVERTAGDQMVTNYSLEDPALLVKEGFLSALGTKSEFKNIQFVQEVYQLDGLRNLKDKFGNAILIDFETMQWRLLPDIGNFSGYHIFYSLRSRLIRLDNETVLWQGFCNYQKDEQNIIPTIDNLTANSAELLKRTFVEIAENCSNQLLVQYAGKTTLGK